IREYKAPAIWTPILIIGEVAMECMLPFIIAKLINEIQAGCEFGVIAQYGGILALMALISLAFGVGAGKTCAVASCGFAKNLRKDLFYRIQDFSFQNIDRFSTSSLVTRLTTDVTNVQMAFMTIIRMAVRAPIMLIFSFTMAFIMGGQMAWIFVGLMPFMAVCLIIIIKKAMPLFKRVFKKYDKINESIQENVKGMRVVKSFVREDYETEKFTAAAEDVCKDFTKAEKILAFNGPVMQFCLYSTMIFVLLFGSYLVISTQGVDLQVGQLSGLLTYSFQILMSLMTVSMVFVMITMASESASRISEVLTEKSTLTSPANCETVVKDGSIDFENVSFRYSASAEKFALSDIDLHIRS
ncbi:MAG: ABC transporter ATP-binding protein, partial [Ruminiclostridium sp.]|nr:ABC transporter ATP-binding protein [Ruminiclostridium sp.]